MEHRAGGRKSAYDSITRVYSPTRGSSAYAYEQAAQEEAWQGQAKPRRGQTARQQPQSRSQMRSQTRAQSQARPVARLSSGTRLMLVFSIVVFAVALLAVMARYNEISRQYLAVNALNRSIDETHVRINQLNVELQCAVNIQEAQEAAARLGLTYPDANQYIRAGEPLVLPEQGEDALPQQSPEPDDPAEPENTPDPLE